MNAEKIDQVTNCRGNVTLSNGRIVIHSRMTNGAQQADMTDGGYMSESEWEEYCTLIWVVVDLIVAAKCN